MKATAVLILFIGISAVLFAQGDSRRHSIRSHRRHRGSGRRNQTCIPREQRVEYQKHMAKYTLCGEPKKTLVPLETPDDFKWIHPSVVYVNRCDGHQCDKPGSQCLPADYTVREFVVEGEETNGVGKKCTTLDVRVHNVCECGCITNESDCNNNQEYNMELCRCQCRDEVRTRCLEKMEENPGMFMWAEKTCSCPCNKELECSTGTTWVPEYCRCLSVSE